MARKRVSVWVPIVTPPVKLLLPTERIAPEALAAFGPRPEAETSRATLMPVAPPWTTREPPLKPGLPVFETPWTITGPVPAPSWAESVMTTAPPRISRSPVKSLAELPSTSVPLPVLSRPCDPESFAVTVTREPPATETVGCAGLPAGTPSVRAEAPTMS